MTVDFNIFDFIDVIFIVLIPIAIMAWMTFWLRRQQRSRKMIMSVWGCFTAIVLVGLTCLLISIQAARTQWLNYFDEMAAAYAVVVSKLDHWKIVAGDENVFSDWSDPVESVPPSEMRDDPKPEPPRIETTAENTQGKLAVPDRISAVRVSPAQVSLHWSPVPGATTYRVQWGRIDSKTGELSEDEEWEAVY